jgi:hypothetical protein
VGLALPWLRSRQKPRFLPAETEPMSEKRPRRYLMRRSRQKPRFLPAETKPMSEKRPQAVFLIN